MSDYRLIESNPPLNPKVSVLTPVCNVERYLGQCIESLLNQDLKDVEFIMLNDGSTDSSLDILLKYQKSDSRIRVVDKPNSGYGATMNIGLSLARGMYIGIVESDDFAEPSMYKKLYSYARLHRCDLVKCGYFEHSAEGDVPKNPYTDFKMKKVFDPRRQIWVTCLIPVIWAALYRRQMIADAGVRFNETPGASFQDTSFVFQCWASARRAAFLPEPYLHYRVDNSGSSVKSAKKVFAVCDEYELTESFLHKDPERLAAFGKIVHVVKLGTYKWNYGRIDAASKEAFADRMSKEYTLAQNRGELDQSLFDPADWDKLQQLLADSRSFVLHHPEVF